MTPPKLSDATDSGEMMPRLLERETALRALAGALQDASQGRGSVALISGEPGIGKSALISRFLTECDGQARVLLGLCDDLATPRPLGPFRDLAAQVDGALAEALGHGRAVGEFPSLLIDDLRTGPAPSVLVIEDVQWADQATTDALTVLGRRLTDLPVLLVLTLRTGEVDLDHPLRKTIAAVQRSTTVHVELAPLSLEAVTELAGDEADRIFAATGGNPFFVTEMIAQDGGPPPPSLANAVLGRVARLETRSRELLELISMVPGRISTDVLDLVAPGWPADAEQAERRQLLTSDAAHARFRHELTRAAIRSSVPPGRRRVLHGRILEAMQALGADAADLVHHAEGAGRREVVAAHAPIAAREAAATGANREAFAQFVRAADTVDRLSLAEQARFWEDFARSAHLAGHVEQAADAAARAIDLATDLRDRKLKGRCLTFRAQLHWFNGEGEAAWRDACDGISSLEPAGPSLELARAFARSSELGMLASRADEAFEWGTRALRLAGDNSEIRARALASIGSMHMQIDPDDVKTLLEALGSADAHGHCHQAVLALTALAYNSLQWGRAQRARAHVEQARQYAGAHEVDTMASYLDAIVAWIDARDGRFAEAEQLARAQLSGRPGAYRTVAGLLARTVLSEIAVRRGDADADEQLRTLAVDADRTGEIKRIGPVLELQVERALTCGRPFPLQRFEDIREIVGAQPLAQGYGAARVAALARVCGLEHGFSGRAPEPYAAMLAGDWQQAADAFGAAGWCYDRALMLSLLDTEQALAEGLEIARAHDARPLEERITHRMRAGGFSVPRGRLASTQSNPAQLTDRQLEVLALVREGKANAQIAQELHISPRTVEHHVSSIFTKLGVTSRAEAVARGVELGVT